MPAPVVAVNSEEILTGEAVALDVQPLGVMMRALGALIDALVSIALLVALLLVMVWLGRDGRLNENAWRMLQVSSIVFSLVLVPATIEAVTRGRSLGKLAVGGRIVRWDGGRIGVRHAALRALAGVLEIWLTAGGLAFVVGAFTPRSQRLGDLLAGTYSERTRRAKLPESRPTMPPALLGWATIADVSRLPVRLSRRLSQFVHQASGMHPAARARTALSLAEEASAHVSPVPQVDPETFLVAVLVARRDRELRALQLEDERTRALLAGSV